MEKAVLLQVDDLTLHLPEELHSRISDLKQMAQAVEFEQMYYHHQEPWATAV